MCIRDSSHAVLQHTVKLRLRTIVFLKIVQELLGGAGQIQILCGAVKFLPCLQNLFLGRLIFKAYKDGAHVAVRNGNTQAPVSYTHLSRLPFSAISLCPAKVMSVVLSPWPASA